MNNNDLLAAVAAYVVAESDGEKARARAGVQMILNGIGTAPARKTESVDAAIRRVLVELGVPSHVKGYSRLICAIRIAVEDPTVITLITKWLYPEVAKEFGDTPARVERAIRHAVELSFERCDFETIELYFGSTVNPRKGKPSNSEFIARIADVIRNGL